MRAVESQVRARLAALGLAARGWDREATRDLPWSPVGRAGSDARGARGGWVPQAPRDVPGEGRADAAPAADVPAGDPPEGDRSADDLPWGDRSADDLPWGDRSADDEPIEPIEPIDALAALRERAAASAATTVAAVHGLTGLDMAPPARRRWRVPARAGAVAAVALVLGGGVVVTRSMADAPSIEVPRGADVEEAAGVVVPEVVVHVVGEVASPGLVRLPDGSRVADAIDAAGGSGPEADLAALNLARVLVDGEQVVVPAPGAGGATPGAGGQPGLLDLNTADAAALDELPGIGPVLADRIVAWRTEHGAFTVVDELAEVSGIGPSLLAGVRDLVRVG